MSLKVPLMLMLSASFIYVLKEFHFPQIIKTNAQSSNNFGGSLQSHSLFGSLE